MILYIFMYCICNLAKTIFYTVTKMCAFIKITLKYKEEDMEGLMKSGVQNMHVEMV